MKIINLLKKYQNGNYQVSIFSDGTKIRRTEENEFIPSFPESIDLKITNCCDKGCPMCHENSKSDGKHGNINHPFINSLQAGTELAIGGGNPLEHPDLLSFLTKLKEKGIIANMTVNQDHLFANLSLIEKMISEKLIYGLGISVTSPDLPLISFCQKHDNAVLHLIAGYHELDVFRNLGNKGINILILGYKQFGRGKKYYSPQIQMNIDSLEKEISNLASDFKIVSFDNLSLEQLKIKSKVSEEVWKNHYMGGDGQYTMYIDLVDEKFASSSTSENRYAILDNIQDMFSFIRRKTLGQPSN